MVSKRTAKNRYQRRIMYLVGGIIVGITVMILPALVHTMMGPSTPFATELTESWAFSSRTIISPLDAIYEFVWLALPAIFVILVLYWIGGRRTRWSGYDDAIKWTRR
jgi:hypothetical protein